MFIDEVQIEVHAGNGGDGCLAFRREKYIAMGGPFGGNGGHGADVVFKVDTGLHTLLDLRYKKIIKAERGEHGMGKNQNGKSRDSYIVKVPQGTVLKEFETGKVLVDMSGDNRRVTVLKGGKGGNGNQHYATPKMQAPKYAQPGQPAQELYVAMELKVIADVGLVGYPNVGKSSLLTKVSNARPEVANYHFTTINPHLGVVDLDDAKGFVMADIPGLIDGASEGVGLGHDFLRHIERTKATIHVVDASGSEGRDPVEDIYAINKELRNYSEDLANRPMVIAANKADLVYPDGTDEYVDPIERIKAEFEPQGYKVFKISALTGEGIRELLYYMSSLLDTLDSEPIVFEQEYFVSRDDGANEPFTVTYDEKDDEYVIEGPKIERMLGYTNLESEKGFVFFQNFMKENEILTMLEDLGIKDGDTVRIYGHSFEYYK